MMLILRNIKLCLQGKYLGSNKCLPMYEILVTGSLCTSECSGECRFFCKPVQTCLDVTADVIVEDTCNTDILTTNASDDFQ